MDKRNHFFKSLKSKTVAFVGIGVSHQQTIELFAKRGIRTIAVEKKQEHELDAAVLARFRELGVELWLGDPDILSLGADVIFRSPGMYYNLPELAEFRHRGGVVTSEIEVFCDLCPCPIFAVTGSDGKTTTTTLISEMLKAEGHTVHLGGNIGRALLPIIFDIQPQDYATVELSSFQLISMRPSPAVSVVTNVTPNHLDVHGTMEEYIDAKRNIYAHQDAFSKTVLGYDNEVSHSFAAGVRGDLAGFSLKTPVWNGAYLNGEVLTLVRHGKEIPLFSKNEIKIPGIHNVANYLTAIAAVDPLVSAENIKKVAQEFGGVEHRIELVRERRGVRWYNDSIASSPTRSIAGLEALSKPLILIAGGYDKKIPYEPLAPAVIKHVKTLILMGATGPKIEQAVTQHPDYSGSPHILHAQDMQSAVELAAQQAQQGDTVVLSPASASFDLYTNFEHRGRHFKELVRALAE